MGWGGGGGVKSEQGKLLKAEYIENIGINFDFGCCTRKGLSHISLRFIKI